MGKDTHVHVLREWLDVDPRRLGRQVALTRIAVGAGVLVTPAGATRRWLRAPTASPEAVTALKMAAGRDLALGLGALLAARRRPEALRGWLEAAALADGVDVYAFVTDRGFSPLARIPAALVAGGTVALQVLAARRIA